MAEELPKEPVGAEQTYLARIAGQDVELPKEPIGPEQAYLNYIAKHGGGGGGGTNDYDDLFDKPKINNVTLSGNKTSSNLSLQDKLVSGTNIKTINNTSILGSGNIDIQGGGTSDYTDLENKPQINSTTLTGNKSLSDIGAQATLVSGTNIKTINNTSLLGSGNIDIQGGDTSEIYSIFKVMKAILKKAEYTEPVTSLFAQLEQLLPDGVTQDGSMLTIRSDVTAVQNGSILTIS